MVVTNEIENYLVLNEKQRKNVCEELARLVFELKKDESVECIYFAPYKNLGDMEGYVLDITIVRNNLIQKEDTKEFEEYNRLHQEEEMVRKYGVKIYVHSNSSQDYIIPASNSIPNTCCDLFQSNILFARYNKYYRIIKMMKNQERMISYYSNLAQIEPPIMNEFNRTLEEQQMEEELDAVRKFTKTEAFQYILNM